MSAALSDCTISQLQEKLRDGQTSCQHVVASFLEHAAATSHLNAYVEIFREEAMARAKELDNVFAKKSREMGKLWGAVLSLKDVISYKGHPLSAGSRILANYQPVYSSTVVDRLLKEDAIIIGVTNCDEFAMGSDNRNSAHGPVSNADHEAYVPGGSSGGAAVSVQSNTCHVALGSDTGGSVRQPASFCNLLGFKPSYGRISRHGLIAYASSFDQIGLIGHHLSDIEQVYTVIQGPDRWDSTLSKKEESSLVSKKQPRRVAYIREALEHAGLQQEIRSTFFHKIEKLQQSGWEVDEVSLANFKQIIPTYYVLTSAEASSNLSRYDGIRYGFRAKNVANLHEMYTSTRSQGFGEEVKRRILLGTFVLSVGYYDAYFAKAQKLRRLFYDQFDRWYQTYQAILLPTTPTTAWKKTDHLTPVEMYLADIYSVLANLVGAPSASLPLGYDQQGLAFGMQIICERGHDLGCLDLVKTLRVMD